VLLRAGRAEVAEAFCASRLGTQHGAAFGTLAPGPVLGLLLERAGAAA
jgi:putative acyl-CoA dehydrogenase